MNTTIPNYLVLKVTIVNPTATKPARVKIQSEHNTKAHKTPVIIPFDTDNGGNISEMALTWLIAKGYNITGTGEGKKCEYIFSDTFKPLV